MIFSPTLLVQESEFKEQTKGAIISYYHWSNRFKAPIKLPSLCLVVSPDNWDIMKGET